MKTVATQAPGISYAPGLDIAYASKSVKITAEMASIYFAGPYTPIMCGIADYTSFITRRSPKGRWGVISFDLEKYGNSLVTDHGVSAEPVWYGIPGRQGFSASVIQAGVRELSTKNEIPILLFQHEFGIWPDSKKFVAMLKDLDMPKVVTFHSIHFQSYETPTGLRSEQYDLLRALLPYVEAITVFSGGAYHAVTSAFPEHHEKVHILKHGIHSYPEVSCLSRKEAKEKLNDYLLYESDLDLKTKETLYEQRTFLAPDTVLVGQTGFLAHAKNSELLYSIRDSLQELIPNKRIVVVRIGNPRDESQKIYAEKLRRMCNGRDKFLLEVWPHPEILPLSQRAFDVNFYWPSDCTQSGILAHGLGAGAIFGGRDLEGVGETLKEAGQLVDTDLGHLLPKIKNLILNRELSEQVEEAALAYAMEYSWENQAWRHYELAEHILYPAPVWRPSRSLFTANSVSVSTTDSLKLALPA